MKIEIKNDKNTKTVYNTPYTGIPWDTYVAYQWIRQQDCQAIIDNNLIYSDKKWYASVILPILGLTTLPLDDDEIRKGIQEEWDTANMDCSNPTSLLDWEKKLTLEDLSHPRELTSKKEYIDILDNFR